MSTPNRIDQVASRVVREALDASPFTQTDLARRLGISQGALSVRFKSGYAWTLGELILVGHFLGSDLLREISSRVSAKQRAAA